MDAVHITTYTEIWHLVTSQAHAQF